MAEHPKHGSFISLENLASPSNDSSVVETIENAAIPVEAAATNLKVCDYFFKNLMVVRDNLPDPTSDVIKTLKDLGAVMKEDANLPEDDSEIPAAHTYLGQFIDHDITLQAASLNSSLQ